MAKNFMLSELFLMKKESLIVFPMPLHGSRAHERQNMNWVDET
jgi:hypothetical protein